MGLFEPYSRPFSMTLTFTCFGCIILSELVLGHGAQTYKREHIMSGGKVLGIILSVCLTAILAVNYLDYGTTMIPGTVDYKACEAIKPIPGWMDRNKSYWNQEKDQWKPCWHGN